MMQSEEEGMKKDASQLLVRRGGEGNEGEELHVDEGLSERDCVVRGGSW
jgi:hypothetical protein